MHNIEFDVLFNLRVKLRYKASISDYKAKIAFLKTLRDSKIDSIHMDPDQT